MDSVLEKFENRYLTHEGVDHITGNWELSERVGPETRDYWEGLMDSDLWKNQWRDKNVELGFGLDLSAWKDPASDKVYLCLDFDTKYAFRSNAE